MVVRALAYLWRRLRPRAGWLPFFFVLAALGCLTAAVVEADWVPESRVVVLSTTAGLALSVALARRSTSAWLRWALITAYGLLLTTIALADLWPPLRVLAQGWEPYARFNRAQVALFLDRWAGWLRAVSAGESSRETVVFAFGLGLLAWLLAAYVGWSAFHRRRPLAGLSAAGVALAVNIYYAGVAQWTAVLFVPLTAMAAAALNVATLHEEWERDEVSYPEQVRWDALIAAGIVAMVLVVLAFVLPAIDVRALSQRFLAQPTVQEVEAAMERAFAGVRPPRQRPGVAGRGVLPNDFLLGNAPELAETIIFTATVSPAPPTGVHWRGLSYDVYNGRGWETSPVRQERLAPGIPLPLSPLSDTRPLTQTVWPGAGTGPRRYTLGLPAWFDEPTELFWRGTADLVRVDGIGETRYRAGSRLSVAGPTALAAADPAAIPPVVLGRYTQLPADVPGRVRDLAAEIAAPHPTAYAQAQAIETFLRQYPYSLDVPLPPAGRDPIDFFLFDLQEGYCDYYASAMVVLARSAGLPARLATGFLPQPPDAAGVQTVAQLNAHSWAEIYLAGYGWIEFEPTAPFASGQQDAPIPTGGDAPPAFAGVPEPGPPPPIPAPAPAGPGPWTALAGAGLALGAALSFWLWRRRRPDGDALERAYAGMQRAASRLGVPVRASQTPAEFDAALAARLAAWQGEARPAAWAAAAREGSRRLAELFARRRYAPPAGRPDTGGEEVAAAWRAIRGPLWLLQLHTRLRFLPGRRRPPEAGA